MDTIDIVLVTYNRIEFTKKTISSIIEKTILPYRLIVVDNNSTDGTREFLIDLKKREKIGQLILNPKNYGLGKALNQGFEFVKSDKFVTVDNDCIACNNWLDRMLFLMKCFPKFKAIACRPQVLVGVGEIFKTHILVVENNVCGGSYRLMDRGVVDSVGGWDENFDNFGRGNEEHDICGKIRSLGHKVGYAKNVWCYHLFGEKNWGYDKSIDAAKGRTLNESPKDVDYNPETCEPKQKCNE